MNEHAYLPPEFREFEDDIRAALRDLGPVGGQTAYPGECHPALDVVETTDAVMVTLDVAGLRPDAVRVIFRRNVLVVAGIKAPLPSPAGAAFHLIEREFGRFARAVSLTGSFDVPGATAELSSGQLHIVLPRRPDRRGQSHAIPVSPSSRP